MAASGADLMCVTNADSPMELSSEVVSRQHEYRAT
jgi:hypothetical protein